MFVTWDRPIDFFTYESYSRKNNQIIMKPKFRVILEMAIEEGVRRGYSRAHKHVENPTEGSVIEHIEDEVMSSIYEYFDFEDEKCEV